MTVPTADRYASLRARLTKDRDAVLDAALTLADSDDAGADLEFALSRAEQLDARLDKLPAPKKTLEVREPDLYDPTSRHSFFADIIATRSPWPVRGIPAHEAIERLNRHAAREDNRRVGLAERQARTLRRLGFDLRTVDTGAVETRALSTQFAAAGGVFIPPKWLLEQFVSVSRAAAPLRELLPQLPLPGGTLELHVPRLDSVAGVVPENLENVAAEDLYDNPEPSTDAIVTPVRTIAGQAIMSQQLLDRTNFDQLAMKDITENYAAVLQAQLVNGTGTNGQILGLLNVPNVETITWTNASPTPTGFVTQVGATAAAVANNRLRPPSIVLMRPARYYWSAAQPDGSTNEPAQRPGTGLLAADADWGPVGPLAGLPVALDATIPTNISGNQDVVLAIRAADMLLLEDEPRFSVNVEQGATSLEVSLMMHVYVAAILNRHPSSIGVLTGTGLAVPAGW